MKAVRWEDTKREIRELEPGWDSPDRVAERERSRAEMRAEQRGYQLAQLRKNAGLTQAQVAALMASHRRGSPRSSTARSPRWTPSAGTLRPSAAPSMSSLASATGRSRSPEHGSGSSNGRWFVCRLPASAARRATRRDR
jgi:hypothetical protein